MVIALNDGQRVVLQHSPVIDGMGYQGVAQADRIIIWYLERIKSFSAIHLLLKTTSKGSGAHTY